MTNKKFTKDIDAATQDFLTTTEQEYEIYKTNKDERLWLNMYFIGQRINTIKWILIIILGMLCFKFLF